MSYRSMTDVAFNVLEKEKKVKDFATLWNEVSTSLQMDNLTKERKIAQFYTELMLDNRFASLENNMWDLRSRHLYDETHISLSEIIDEDDECDDEECGEELEEEDD